MKKQNPSIIRIYDKVKIINPEFFVRCGYPWSKQHVLDNIITPEERQKIASLFGSTFVEHLSGDAYKPYEQTLNSLAYYKLRQNNFGGRERSIHTELKPDFKDKILQVIGKKTVKTGSYCNGSCYGDEGDWEPAYLIDEKTHIILNVWDDEFYLFGDQWIERKNVEKIPPETIVKTDEY